MTLRLTAVLSFALVAPAIAQAPQTAPAAVRPSATSRAVEPPGPPVPLGPYAEVTIDAAEGLPTHTVYRPTDLSAFPARDKLPIVVWGNGACRIDGLMYQRFLTKIASHGFLVVVVGRRTFASERKGRGCGAGSGARPQQPGRTARAGRRRRNRRAPDSGDRLGHQGKHPRRQPAARQDRHRHGRDDGSVVRRPHGDRSGARSARRHAGHLEQRRLQHPRHGRACRRPRKRRLATIHSNTAYFNGGVSDIAYENSNDDVSRINQVPLFYGVMKEAGHAATYAHVNGGKFAEVGANWLLWRLKGDKKAGAMFDGPECGLCQDPAWTVQKRKGWHASETHRDSSRRSRSRSLDRSAGVLRARSAAEVPCRLRMDRGRQGRPAAGRDDASPIPRVGSAC